MTLRVSINYMDISRWWHRERELWPFNKREMAIGAIFIGAWLVYALAVIALPDLAVGR